MAARAHEDKESGFIYSLVDSAYDAAHLTLLAWLRDNDLILCKPDGSFTDTLPEANPTTDTIVSDYFDIESLSLL